VTGFIDGDGCFTVQFNKRANSTYQVQLSFAICLHIKDDLIIKHIKSFFGGVGQISYHSNKVYYRVRKLNDINSFILPHFESYPLQTSKSIELKL
jgi:hypothetical protein